MANRIQLRRDTTANWNNIDPVLADGEPGYDIVTNEIRIGNGSDAWSELSGNTISGGGGSSTGDVTFSGINIIGDDNLRLQPNATVSTSYLDVYLTTGPDIHVVSSDGNLILGQDSAANVRVGTDGNVQIRAQNGVSANTWTFNPDGNLTIPGNLIGNFISSPAPIISGFGNANFTGNITAGNILLSSGGEIKSAAGVGNVVIEANDGVSRVWKFASNAAMIFPDSTVQTTAYVAADNVSRVTGSWTVTVGSADYSFTVPQNGTYTMWVRGNIPNGIITWNATATVTNNNVPVLGQQFAWNYNGVIPMPLEITALPVQFIGTANTIITSNTYGGGPSNTFTFTVNNASGSSRTVYWGYVTQ